MTYFVPGGAVAASQQFPANQTDVFSIDEAGQLTVSWVIEAGDWQGPLTIGPVGLTTPGAFVAASRQFGLNQTDAFLVDKGGQLNVFWVDGQGAWAGPEKIGPAGIAAPGGFIAASQQFGLNQTDVFLVDKNGQLNVFWVDNAGAWAGPEKIGPTGIASPGCYVAASQQFGLNQTDVFLVDKTGQLNVFWVDNAGAWAGPEKIGPAGFATPGSFVAASQQIGLNQTDVFLVDKNGQLNVFWVDNAGAWAGPEKIGPAGIASPGGFIAASRQFGLNQTDVFLVDKTGQLNVFWVDNAGAWAGPEKIGAAGIAGSGSFVAASQQFGLNQTDVFLVDKNGRLNVFWVDNAGAWNGPLVRQDPVAAPPGGLGSNSNYFLYSNCTPLKGVSVTVDVSQQIVASAGFGFQLNAYSSKNEKCAYQQYCIAVDTSGGVHSIVDNWDAGLSQLINHWETICSLPSAALPAGYKLTISLATDSNSNVTGATFAVADNQGNTRGSVTQTLLSLSGVTSADLAPIVAFELDFVGYDNGQSTVLSSGAGSIIYDASSILTPLSQEPSCTQGDAFTEETANSVYGVLSGSPSNVFTQSFTASATAQLKRRTGPASHHLTRPPG